MLMILQRNCFIPKLLNTLDNSKSLRYLSFVVWPRLKILQKSLYSIVVLLFVYQIRLYYSFMLGKQRMLYHHIVRIRNKTNSNPILLLETSKQFFMPISTFCGCLVNFYGMMPQHQIEFDKTRHSNINCNICSKYKIPWNIL